MSFNMQEGNVPTSMTTSTKQRDKEEAKRKILSNMQVTKGYECGYNYDQPCWPLV